MTAKAFRFLLFTIFFLTMSQYNLFAQTPEQSKAAEQFVLHSRTVPDFRNIDKGWLAYGSEEFHEHPVIGGLDKSENISDDISWIRKHASKWEIFLIFKVRRYRNNNEALKVAVYSFMTTNGWQDICMDYRSLDPQGNTTLTRTAILINDRWHVNRTLQSPLVRDSDIYALRLAGTVDESKHIVPSGVLLGFPSVDGFHSLWLKIPPPAKNSSARVLAAK